MSSGWDDLDLRPSGPQRYATGISDTWQLAQVPQGGVVAAIAVRAMQLVLGHPEQTLRTMTAMFAGQVAGGPVEIEVQVLRRGRSMSQLTATVRNVGAAAGLTAIAAFGAPRRGFDFTELVFPDVPGPEGVRWGGQSLIAQLLLACERAGVDTWLEAPLTDLLSTAGTVTGAVIVKQGEQLHVQAPAGVLLASGGFERNAEMRRQYQQPSVARADWTLGVEANTGDGIRAGIALGAATDLLEDCWWAPGFIRPDGGSSFLLCC